MSDDALATMSDATLRLRHALGLHIVRLLRTDWRHEDGQPEALALYRCQLQQIKDELRRRRQAARAAAGEEKPPTQTVHAKTARLGAKKPK